MKKNILITLMIFSLVVFTFTPKVSAGAPKIIYEVGETLVEASIKAVQARKGFKVVEGASDSAKASEVFTESISKGLQDSATGAYQTIKGATLNSTPLRNLPGWMKVTVGTAAFLTGADLAIDAYNKIQSGIALDFFSTPSTGSTNKYKSIGGYTVVVGPYTGPNSYTSYDPYDVTVWKPDGTGLIWRPIVEKGKTTLSSFVALLSVSTSGAITLYYTNQTATGQTSVNTGFTMDVTKMNDYTTVQPYTVSKTAIGHGEVPQIDTSKETQTLIVPDPAVFPNVDTAIAENPEMVADPETWLEQNPQYDPDVEPVPEPSPEPGTETPTEPPGTETPIPPGDPDKFNLEPLKVNLEQIKHKFPFSIPWDVYNLFARFNVEPITPKFDFSDNSSINLGGHSIPVNFDWKIDFSFFDPIAKIARWGLVIVFDICIILALRRLTPD